MTNHTDALNDLQLSGIGTASGGTYRTVSISGVGTVNGDLEAEQLIVSGTGAIKGNVMVKEARLSGAGSITGDLTADQLDVSGAGTVNGHVRSKRAHLSGSAKMQQDLEADEVDVSGSIHAQGDLRATTIAVSGVAHVRGSVRARVFGGSGAFSVRRNVDVGEFRSSGAFDIGGRLAADLVEIRPSGPCTVNTLVGKTVSVIDDPRRCGGSLERRRLTADSIAAVEISLELTTAGIVCGRAVRIGPGCEIDTVEYGDSLDVDPKSTVKHTKYTGNASPAPEPDKGPEEHLG